MNIDRCRRLCSRHQASVKDLTIVGVFLGALIFYAFEVGIFVDAQSIEMHRRKVDNEIAALAAAFAVAMLVYAVRRSSEQKKETRRRVAAEHEVRELALKDGLTGLPNRRQYDQALKAAIATPARAGATHAAFMLDLNGFKKVNDIYGHAVGDEVLGVVARRLQGALRSEDLVARFGGDEFAVLSHHISGIEGARNVATRLLQALSRPISAGRIQHQIGAGIGIALFNDTSTPTEALRQADVALYRAKAERRSAMRFFEEAMDRQAQERAAIERELRIALTNGEISTVFKPSRNLRSGEIVAFEVSPRWRHPVLGVLPLERFVPVAEETGLIHELLERTLSESCDAAKGWPIATTLSIELSPVQLESRDLAERMLGVLQETGLDPRRLEVGITESALVKDFDAARTVLGSLKRAGVQITLNNFGTGYASLYHLRNLRIDKIKIDRVLIESMASKQEAAAIVNALIGLGEGLGLIVAAEGIDDAYQAAMLRSHCAEGQGKLFGGALSKAEAAEVARCSAAI